MVIVGILAGVAAVGACLVLADLDPSSDAWMLAGRAGVSVLAALGLLAAEAILFVRPWFYRAAVALVAAWLLVVTAALVLADGVWGVFEAFVATVVSFMFVGPIMSYLGEKNRLMPRHPRAFVRMPGSRGTP